MDKTGIAAVALAVVAVAGIWYITNRSTEAPADAYSLSQTQGTQQATPQQQQPVAPVWQPPPAPFAMATQPQQALAVTSLILGMCSMTLGWCCGPVGLLTGPAAIGTGIFALVQIKNDPTQYGGKPLAIIGIATGGLFLLRDKIKKITVAYAAAMP